MEILSVFVAAFASFVIGALWYMALAEPWMQDARIPRGSDGKPEGGQSGAIFAATFALQVLVAGMMRHVFATSGVEGVLNGVVSGAGVGLFFIAPWIMLNNLYGMRPLRLTMIDGGYATVGCAAMGLVLVLF